eukprot:gene20988-biopygen1751
MSRGGCSRLEPAGIEAVDPARDRQLRFQLDSGREH